MKQRMFITAILIAGMVQSQDLHLSQYLSCPMTLNPAQTSVHTNSYRAHLQYRNQWKSIVSNPFVTSMVAFDMPVDKFGFGAYILNNKAGSGQLKTLNFLTSVSYEVTQQNRAGQHLICGLQMGLIHKSINTSALFFENQYTTSNGGGFDSNIASGETFQKTSTTMFDLNFGLYYYNRYKMNIFDKFKVKTSEMLPFYVGISSFHLLEPKETFFGTSNWLPRRYVGYGGVMVGLSPSFALEPSIYFMKQKNNHEFQGGITGYYDLKGTNFYLILGANYRNKESLIVNTGFVYKEYSLRFSYDVTLFDMHSVSNRHGGMEISITYLSKKKLSFSLIE